MVEDWSDQLPVDLRASFDGERTDSTPPPSGEQERFGDEAAEVTPIASWTHNLPPPLPRPQ